MHHNMRRIKKNYSRKSSISIHYMRYLSFRYHTFPFTTLVAKLFNRFLGAIKIVLKLKNEEGKDRMTWRDSQPK